jgi:hypothetical protein
LFNTIPSGLHIQQPARLYHRGTWSINQPTAATSLCDCKDFYEYQGPCTHAIAAIRRQGNDPLTLFLNQYTTDYFRRTYSHPVIPVSINDLQSDSLVLPPLTHKQTRRPRTKGHRKGQWARKQRRCGNCLDWGHSRLTCRGQPVSSGRRERARDWLAEIVGIEFNNEEGNDSDDSTDSDKTGDVIVVESGDELSDYIMVVYVGRTTILCNRIITRLPSVMRLNY